MTGAGGFLGAHITRRLLDHGHDVRAILSPTGSATRLAPVQADIRLLRADVRDRASLASAFSGCEAVVHAAARVADWGDEAAFISTNAEGTRNALKAAAGAGCDRFVHVSSVAVHAYRGQRDADPESDPLDGFINAYARSKVAAELAVRASGLDWCVIRPGLWPYGEADPNLARVAAALRQGRLPLVDSGRAVFNPAWAGNVAEGVALASASGGAARRTFVIADDAAVSWAELLGELARLLGASPPSTSLPGWLAAPAAAVTEAAWAVLAPGREPPLTRYRASLMRRDVHFSLAHTVRTLGYAPLLDWRRALARSVASLR